MIKRERIALNRNTLQSLALELSSIQKNVTSRVFKSPFKRFLITDEQEEKLDQYYFDIENNRINYDKSDSATDWFVDNYYTLKRQLKSIRNSVKNIPNSIPVLKNDIMRGFPRIYAIAVEYIDFNGGIVDENGIKEFLFEYQKELPLKIDELWSLSSAFSLALARNMVTLAARRYEFLKTADKLITTAETLSAGQAGNISDYVNVNDTLALAVFVEAVENRNGSENLLRWLDSELSRINLTANEVIEFSRRIESNCAITIRNTITSLMNINMLDWEDIFSEVSLYDKAFMRENGNVFANSDAESKNIYRKRLKEYAHRKNMDELECANFVVDTANERGTHIGEILFDEEKKKPAKRKLVYLTTVYVLTLFFFYLTLNMLLGSGYNAVLCVVIAVLSIIPLKSIVLTIVNFVASRLVRPTNFLRYDFEKGIPSDCKTVVLVPALITSDADAKSLVNNMEVNYIANKSENVCFVLLGDLKESDCENSVDDDKVKAAAINAIAELNKKYSKNLFFYMQRPRQLNKTQERWFGWERKRGAVIQFNRFIQTGIKDEFCYMSPNIDIIVGTKYIVTLDADTKMPPSSLFFLVATAAHPMNRPVFDPERGRVVSGYGILQPRMDTTLPSALKTRFSLIMSGNVGSEPYSSSVSEIYQDIFDEGSFGGKGIYDSKVFSDVIDGRFPENAILSHDMIEGGYMHAGYVSDISFADDVPSNYVAYRKRAHRWQRGDWQLLPYILPYVKNSNGETVKNTLYWETKYKIFENLRQSLFEAAICILFAVGLFVNKVFLLGTFFCVLNAFLPLVFDVFDTVKLKIVHDDNKKISDVTVKRCILSLALTGDNAFNNADAAVRTVARLKSRKKLLEWQTAMQAEAGKGNTIKTYYTYMKYSVLFSLALILTGAFYVRWYVLLFGMLFAVAPFIMYTLGKKRVKAKPVISAEGEAAMELQAKGAWLYFKELCNVENNYLPPDNFQEEPYKGAVDRTSTTNIGMMLVAVISAVKLEYQGMFDAVDMIRNTLLTLVKLEKWNGHPYNWYDIKTLKPLEPKFVSSADNGNLCCSLIAVREALNEYRSVITDESVISNINECIKIIAEFLNNIDFSRLYDSKKDLFSVGYNVSEDTLSKYSYDLFASEARLASFFAVIKSQVPAKHWSRLSRILVRHGRKSILKSWSGSIFEYLMPALFMKTYDETITSVAFDGIVKAQIRYADKIGRAWGISESGYWLFDDKDYYQYKAFGIPYAAVRHINSEEYVISPYSTALAAMVAPKEASKNLVRLKNMSLCGRYGFYEACDMSGNSEKIIKSYMAHHQGMSIAAITNYLCDNYIAELFHSAPEVKAGEILLQEKVPLIVPKDAVSKKTVDKPPKINTNEVLDEKFYGITLQPHCTLLTNGNYSVLIGNTGGNVQFNENILINKWQSDNIIEKYGHFIFIRDEESKCIYSAMPSPLYEKCSVNTVFRPDRVSFFMKRRGIETMLDIAVSPEKNASIYSLTVKNTQNRTKVFTVADYIEPALDGIVESKAHPVYSDMFIKNSFLDEYNAIIAERFPHKENAKKQYMSVVLSCDEKTEITPVMSRYDIVGRNRSITNPLIAAKNFNFDNVKNTGLCPALSLSTKIEIPQGKSVKIAFTVLYSDNYEYLINMCEYFNSMINCTHEFESAYEHKRLLMQYKHIDQMKYKVINSITTRLYYPQSFRHGMTLQKKSFLWQFGISGDYPIICVTVDDKDMSGVKLLLTAYEYIAGSVKTDLVIITNDDGYHSDIFESVRSIVTASPRRDMLNKKGGIFILRGENDGRINIVKTFAAINVSGSEQKICSDLAIEDKYIKRENITILPKLGKRDAAKNIDIPELTYFNGYGGFNENKSEYTIILDNGVSTPHPWSHILANDKFGSVVTESGGGYTWYKNSYENKLTSWSNDPVSDTPSEVIYIKDEATMQYMTPQRIVPDTGKYVISYGLGYARYCHNANKLNIVNTVTVPERDSVKISVLEIENDNDVGKKLSLYYYVDCNLSSAVSANKDDISVMTEKANGIVFAENLNVSENGYMFLGCNGCIDAVLTKKIDFFGRTGSFAHPKALDYSTWNNTTGKSGADCIVIKTTVEVKAHSKIKKVFLIGGAETYDSVRSMKAKYANADNAVDTIKNTTEYFEEVVLPFRITTNDKSLDLLFNNFLMYQVYVCRYMAKTSFYQCSGAYGFRDQLQDTLAFMYCNKKEARNHILRAAEQQFEDGDVRHWWHEDTGYGIRTKISDDMMFLPYVCLEYASFADDWEIFDEEVPFVKNVEIEDGKHSYFGKAEFTQHKASVYEHCILAIKRSMRFGEHNLPLIGTGDWNDGFDKIGKDGKGESVWLAFFIHYVIRNFSAVCIRKNDTENVRLIAEYCSQIEKGIKEHAWDGEWYRRAYYDDGMPVGSSQNDECKIDVIAQAWAAIANITPYDDVGEALESVEKHLVDRENSIVKLFSPPFESTDHDPGYIKAYRAGIRENGGQYTHGAIWLIMAYAVRGEAKKAYDILSLLNPINHARTKSEAEMYKVEPFVVAADVYSMKGNEGMGGWTWYTGSAAWMYKVILEYMLGIKISGNKLSVKPCMPEDMIPFRLDYKFDKNGTTYTIDVLKNNGDHSTVDGEYCTNDNITLSHDGKHHKIVIILD